MKTDENFNLDLPLVSIITPSFNQGKFIRETIESVLNQDYSNIEYWVIDGGSTDETVDILKEYDGKINWISEKDEGQADAVNKGIKLAKGTIIGWLNSDDIYMQDAVSHIVKFFKKHPNVDMVYGEGYFIDENSQIIDRYNTENFSINRLAQTCIVCQPTAFLKKGIVKEVGYLDKRLNLCMDYELWIKIAQKGNIMYSPKYLAASRMYNENKTLSRKWEVNEEVCKTLSKYFNYVPLHWIYGAALHNNNIKKHFINLTYLLFKNYYKYNRKHLYLLLIDIKNIFTNKVFNSINFYGKYYDEWISDKYKFSIKLNEPCNKMYIHGSHVLPKIEKLEITIYIDGYKKGKLVLDKKGGFYKELKFTESINRGKHRVMLIMNQTYCPNNLHIIADKRNLSLKLHKINFIN